MTHISIGTNLQKFYTKSETKRQKKKQIYTRVLVTGSNWITNAEFSSSKKPDRTMVPNHNAQTGSGSGSDTLETTDKGKSENIPGLTRRFLWSRLIWCG